MAKIHKIQHRMKSVAKIQQITSAMERVAASKMRRAQTAALRSRAYANTSREILAQLFLLTDPKAHPLFAQRRETKRLLVVYSSDRGLAGSYNSNVNRVLNKIIADNIPTEVIVIGRRGASLCARLELDGRIKVIGAYTDWPAQPAPATLQPIVDTVINKFSSRAVDSVYLLFTDFVSGLQQVATCRQLLPIKPADVITPSAQIGELLQEALFEPSPAAVLAYMVPRLISIQLYQANLEAAASEQSMRMVAMKNASDNATQLIDDLALTFNSARQAAITQELAEISAGVEAMHY